jgi:hypothetical protein
MILLSLILLLGIGTMPDLHSSSESTIKAKAEIALQKLNAALPATAEKLRLSDFNATGQRDLSFNSRCSASTLATVILGHHQSGYLGGDGYYTALNGNNAGRLGRGDRGNYETVVKQLKNIQKTAPHSTTGDGGSGYAEGHAAPISTPTPELMTTTTPPAIPHPAAIPQPAPSHHATGALSTAADHRPPRDVTHAFDPIPARSETGQPVTPPTQPMDPQETPLPQSNTGSQSMVLSTPPTSTPATPHTTQTGNTGETTGSPATLPQQPGQPVVQPPLTPLIRTRIPYTKIQKGAIGGGFLATAAGLAWLFTLLAQKESREDIKLFWGKLFSKKTRAAVATRAARIRSEIKRHGNESIGALTTTLAGLGLLLYGGLPRYHKPTHAQGEIADVSLNEA